MGEGVYVLLGAIVILVVGMFVRAGRASGADEPAPAPAAPVSAAPVSAAPAAVPTAAPAASDEEDEIAAVIAAALAAYEADTGKKGRVLKAKPVTTASVSLWNMMAVKENVINRGR